MANFRSTAGTALAAREWCPFAGYEMPIQYEGIMAEHLLDPRVAPACSTSAIWASCSSPAARSTERAREPAARPTSPSLKDGAPALFAAARPTDGGIIDDLMATRRGDHFYVVVNGATKHGDIRPSRGARLPRAVVLDHMKEQALLALQGPGPVEALDAAGSRGRASSSFMTGGAFRARTAPAAWISRSGLYRRGRLRDLGPGRATSRRCADALVADARGASRSGSARAIRCGSRRACRSTATTSTRRRRRSRPTSTFAIVKRRRAEGGFPGLPPDPRGTGRRADPQSASACVSRAASRCARARWCSMQRAAKSAR